MIHAILAGFGFMIGVWLFSWLWADARTFFQWVRFGVVLSLILVVIALLGGSIFAAILYVAVNMA